MRRRRQRRPEKNKPSRADEASNLSAENRTFGVRAFQTRSAFSRKACAAFLPVGGSITSPEDFADDDVRLDGRQSRADNATVNRHPKSGA